MNRTSRAGYSLEKLCASVTPSQRWQKKKTLPGSSGAGVSCKVARLQLAGSVSWLCAECAGEGRLRVSLMHVQEGRRIVGGIHASFMHVEGRPIEVEFHVAQDEAETD